MRSINQILYDIFVLMIQQSGFLSQRGKSSDSGSVKFSDSNYRSLKFSDSWKYFFFQFLSPFSIFFLLNYYTINLFLSKESGVCKKIFRLLTPQFFSVSWLHQHWLRLQSPANNTFIFHYLYLLISFIIYICVLVFGKRDLMSLRVPGYGMIKIKMYLFNFCFLFIKV